MCLKLSLILSSCKRQTDFPNSNFSTKSHEACENFVLLGKFRLPFPTVFLAFSSLLYFAKVFLQKVVLIFSYKQEMLLIFRLLLSEGQKKLL